VTSVDAELNVGGERRHQRGQERRHHHADEAGRQQPHHQRRIRIVALDLRVERASDEARQHEHEHRQHFEQATEDRAAARVLLGLRAEHALHDHLIGAPVPDAEDRRAEEDAGPRERGIGRGLHHVKEVRRQRLPQAGHSARLDQPQHAQRDRTGEQHDRLHELGVDDRRETAEDRIDSGRDHHHRG
jgi:hypothetical protein